MDTDVLITDDGTELTSATVTLTNHDTDDVLVAGALPPGITASAYNSATGILTLTGTASLAAYQTALQQITFDNTGTTPSTATRVIDIVVNDGASNSNTAKAFIQVDVVNNSAPVLDLDPNDSGGSVREHLPDGIYGERRSGADRRRGYLHHGSRQHRRSIPPRSS